MTAHDFPANNSFSAADKTAIQLSVPPTALKVIDVLESAGFEAWSVGGFVRDSLLRRPVSDIDIACSSLWPQTKEVCENAGMRVHETGAAHGTVTVVCDNDAFEVTTFRIDGKYSDGRHPDRVEFVRSIEQDLARRDFTINAIAYHPGRGILDPFDGLADSQAGVLRTVGDPQKRFAEDALRILRACRFSSQLGFAIEADTYQAMLAGKSQLLRVSKERITAELTKLLLGDHVCRALMETVDVLAVVLPELVAMKGFGQHTPFHVYDVLEHTARAVAATPAYPLVRWAALFHDMGKPAAFFREESGQGHFYGHPTISTQLARGILQRLSFSTAFSEKVLTLVERHDEIYDPNRRTVRRALARLGGDVDLFRTLCELKHADASAHAPESAAERMERAEGLLQILDEVLAADDAFTVRKLAINGHDVMGVGIEPGPEVGAILEAALEAVIDERVPNDREELLAFVKDQKADRS